MYCIKCGKQINNDAKFCKFCGEETKSENSIVKPFISNSTDKNKADTEGNKKTIVIIAVLIVVIATICVTLCIYMRSKDEKNNDEVSQEIQLDEMENMGNMKNMKNTEDMEDEIDTQKEDDNVVEKEERGGQYVIEDSDTRLLSGEDLEGLTAEELRLARNEIYARHGRKFKDEGLQSYFNQCEWYEGTIEPDNFTEDRLSEIEIQNKDLIIEFEEKSK